MRTIVELPHEQLVALAAACEREHISRAEAVRRAVAYWLEHASQRDFEAAFGSWSDVGTDAVEYVRSLRSDWER